MPFDEYWYKPAVAGTGKSLRFRQAQYLTRTNTTNGTSSQKWTFSGWVKRGKFDSNRQFSVYNNMSSAGDQRWCLEFYNGISADQLTTDWYGFGSYNLSNARYRDPGAWMHIVWAFDSTQATGSDRTILYVNGEPISDQHIRTVPQNQTYPGLQLNGIMQLGRIGDIANGGNFEYFDGYMSECHLVDGQQLQPTVFGEFNADGVWVPKTVTGLTYGNLGFYLDFSDVTNIGADRSGNGNNFTPTGFELTNTTSALYDWVADVPFDNYSTVNPLYPGASTSNANLTTANATGKPTVLPGTPKTVSVGGATQTWDGTEAGWTYTGDIDFGQRNAAVNDTSTAQLPAVAITNPSNHFQTVLDTGANILTTAQATFPNGLWWIKDRVNSAEAQFVDSVRGPTICNHLPGSGQGNQTYAAPAGDSAAYCWSAPTALGASGQRIQGALNTTAGFSIIQYTGNGANNMAVPHGLSQAPDFMIIKCESPSGAHFLIYHRNGLGTRALYLNLTNVWTNTGYWPTEPDGTNFYVGTDGNVNTNGQTYIAYCWHTVPGYSSFPAYDGNGNAADGVFLYLGHRAAFNLFKAMTVSTGGLVMSSAESPGNPVGPAYATDQTTVGIPGVWLDINSNGLKMRTDNPQANALAGYMLASFAEHPFGGSNVSPSPAR